MSRNEEVYLPHDLVIEIMPWLPPETLLRCRSVCKSWYSTISDPNFITKHREKAKKGRIVIVTQTVKSVPLSDPLKFRLFPDNNPGGVSHNLETVDNSKYGGDWRVKGTCNGLFCYAGFRDDCASAMSILLCNPSIRWTTLLPPCQFALGNPEAHYQVSVADFNFGFGFDPIERDYKVLKIRLASPNQPGEAAIFSLKSKSWKKVESAVPYKASFPRSVFLHGSMHWLNGEHPNFRAYTSIMLFDIHNETFGEMPLPETLENVVDSLHGVGGSLCAIVFNKEGECCQVWTMRDYGVVESWIEQFKIVLPYGILRQVELTVGGKLILHATCGRVARHGKLVFDDRIWMLSRVPRIVLILYDPQTGEYTNVCRLTSNSNVFSVEGSLECL